MTLNMKSLIMTELVKFLIFTSACALVVYCLQKRYERIGNQFALSEHEEIYHGKIYTSNSSIIGAKILGSKTRTCPLYPSTLQGTHDVNTNDLPTFKDLEASIPHLNKGGFHEPRDCAPREKLAIIIPYRDRETNLLILLKYLHPLLQRQSRYYRIILIEQFGDDIFNKGRIMNIAVKEALKIDSFDCFIFHDVDLIPENDKNIYECYSQPRHLSPAVDELRYNLMYYNLVGGVLALNRNQLTRTNGFSNLYWGWGAEDDDMSMRIIDCGYKITRPTNDIGRYKMFTHKKRVRAINRFELLDYWKRYSIDGISSLGQFNYTIKSIQNEYLYTNITVDVGPPVREIIDKTLVPSSKFRFV